MRRKHTNASFARFMLMSMAAREGKRSPEPTNADRAQWAKRTAEYFRTRVCKTDQCDAVGDLICDLLHLCDADPTYGDARAVLGRAQRCWEAEVAEAKAVASCGS